MNTNDPYYPDGNNPGISIREKIIFDIYVKSCDKLYSFMNQDYIELNKRIAENSIKAADILLEQLKKEEKQ